MHVEAQDAKEENVPLHYSQEENAVLIPMRGPSAVEGSPVCHGRADHCSVGINTWFAFVCKKSSPDSEAKFF